MKILVISHKNYDFPKNSIYQPILVGAELSQKDLGILKDNLGENISVKNPYFCELTGLYWAFKNQSFLKDVEYIGLVHYRRYFKGRFNFHNKHILSELEIKEIFKKYEVILAKKTKKNGYIM